MKWHRIRGEYVSADKHWLIAQDEGVTFCDEPHPVRLSTALVQEIKERPECYPHEAQFAVRTGAKGYMCPSGEQHTYVKWYLYEWADNVRDYVLRDGYRTLRQAKADVEGSLR